MSGWERAINMNCKSDAELGGMFAHIPPIQGFFVFFASPALRIFNSLRFRGCENAPEPHHFDPECGPKCNIRTGDKFHDLSRKTWFGCRLERTSDITWYIGSLRN